MTQHFRVAIVGAFSSLCRGHHSEGRHGKSGHKRRTALESLRWIFFCGVAPFVTLGVTLIMLHFDKAMLFHSFGSLVASIITFGCWSISIVVILPHENLAC